MSGLEGLHNLNTDGSLAMLVSSCQYWSKNSETFLFKNTTIIEPSLSRPEISFEPLLHLHCCVFVCLEVPGWYNSSH